MPRAMIGALVLAAALAGSRPSAPAPTRTETVAVPTLCGTRGPRSYSWPVKPFWKAHPVRGNFGDPRTVFRTADAGNPDARGAFSFHNGVDIVAPAGTKVYPVASGIVHEEGPDEIIIAAANGRVFQYWHLRERVREGQRVIARRTVLGTVRRRYGHVHLTEIDDDVVENPLAPGHLWRYHDSSPPVVSAIGFFDSRGRRLRHLALKGEVSIVAAAHDTSSIPVPKPWNGLPVTPAELSWRLTTLSGREVVPDRIAVDFRVGQPPNDEFWRIFAAGTYQNSPAVGRRYLGGLPGSYVFNLTPLLLDTSLFDSGAYLLTVSASDVCGNVGTLTERVWVLRHPVVPRPLPLPRPALGSAVWPTSRSGYTVVLASVPRTGGLAQAKATAVQARAAGLRRVGVLDSSRFSSLRPGYYVVFSGVYPTMSAALAAAAKVAAHYPSAYAKRVAAQHRLAMWPARRAGYTVVLASLPAGTGAAAAARAAAAEALGRNLPRVGVLDSSLYVSLRPGYYVIFSGVYRTMRAAQAAVAFAATRYPSAYARMIAR